MPMTEEVNIQIAMHGNSVEDTLSFLTEFAQMQRVVGNHGKAERAEVLRNNIHQQVSHLV
jgi:hypothetical protein